MNEENLISCLMSYSKS